jgi:hypothetical protein
LQQEYSNLHLYDANLFGAHDYADSEANNPGHLCPVGAGKLSARIDTLLTAILGN